MTLPVVVVIIAAASAVLLVVCAASGHRRLIVVAAVVLLSLMNNSFVVQSTASIGVGAPLILTVLVAASLTLGYRLHPLVLPSRLAGTPIALLALALGATAVSMFSSSNPLQTLKAVVGLALLMFVGWLVFGNMYLRHQGRSRDLLILISDVVGSLSVVLTLLVVALAGPVVMSEQLGGTGFSVLGMSLYRLQLPGFNATIVGIWAGLAVLWLLAMYQRSAGHRSRQALALVFLAISGIALIWTGSRGPMVALFATVVLLIVIEVSVRSNSGSRLLIFQLAVILGGAWYLFVYQFSGILYRSTGNQATTSLLDLFLASRLPGVELSVFTGTSLTGHGFSTAGDVAIGGVNIESFFFRIWFQLGLVGSVVYVLAFVALTFYVVRCDRIFSSLGERGAYFPSAIFVFTWMNSPGGYGFALPTGGLAIQFALAAGAIFAWNEARAQDTRIRGYPRIRLWRERDRSGQSDELNRPEPLGNPYWFT